MSQYIYFFLKTDNSPFIMLWESSRNSTMYQEIQECAHVPYEKIREVGANDLNRYRNHIDEQISNYQNDIEHHRAKINQIGTWNNAPNDKYDLITNIEDSISAIEEEIEDLEHARNGIEAIMNVRELNDESHSKIYVGIECPYPTEADIEQK